MTTRHISDPAQLSSDLRRTRRDTSRAARRLALLCRNRRAPLHILSSVAREVSILAGRLAGLAHLSA